MMLRTDDSNGKFKEELLLKNFCLDILSDENQNCSDKCRFWSENVRPLFQALLYEVDHMII